MENVSIIIPAFNEAQTIAAVVAAARATPRVSEVLVVDDGSTDDTAAVAQSAGAAVARTLLNGGKAHAMDEGVKLSVNRLICFVDADLKGITPQILETIIHPVVAGRLDMSIAIRGRQPLGLNHFLRFLPKIGGERCLTKELWYLVPPDYKQNFQIELALNFFARKHKKRVGTALFPGLAQVIKEKKYGFRVGFWRRLKMTRDIAFVIFKLYIIESLKFLPKEKASYI